MAKLKTAYFCQNCGAQYSKWQGQCYTCKQWNTIVEEVVQKDTAPAWQEKESPIKNKAPKPKSIPSKSHASIATITN